jgi:thiamine biosynthesis lipoprotein
VSATKLLAPNQDSQLAKRIAKWIWYFTVSVVGITGVGLIWTRYFLASDDPFSIINHPMEPYLRNIHIFVAPLLLIAFGYYLRDHFFPRIYNGKYSGKKSGLSIVLLISVQVVSGYWMQTTIDMDFRNILMIIHISAGLGFLFIMSIHFYTARSVRMKKRTDLPISKMWRFNWLLFIFLFLWGTDRPVECSCFDSGIERKIYLMGTEAVIQVCAATRSDRLDTSEKLIKILENTEADLSTWIESSEASGINKLPFGTQMTLSNSTCSLLPLVQFWVTETSGTFHPGAGYLHAQLGPSGAIYTEKSGIEQAWMFSAYLSDYFELDPVTCVFRKHQPFILDTGGFGKGEALDRAREYSISKALSPWMMNLGGQVMIFQGTKNNRTWKFDIAHPEDRFQAVMTVEISHGSLATSGIIRDRRSGTNRISHITDPRTGKPAEFNGSVTVWHSSGLAADILSTALFVMGPEEGIEWAEKREVAACFLDLEEPGTVPRLTSRFKQILANQ